MGWPVVRSRYYEARGLLAAQDQPTYYLSFTQVRVIASFVPESLTQLDGSPRSLPKEVEFAKTSVGTSRGLGFRYEMALSLNPTLKSGVSTNQTSGVECSTNRWTITSHADTNEMDGDPGMESDIAIRKYVHKYAAFFRVEGWSFDRDICPSVKYGFKQIRTQLQVEMR